jgi:hypothetical protein
MGVKRAARILTDADIPGAITRDAETTAAVAAHAAATDPHPVYLTQAEGDGRYRQSAGAQTFSQGIKVGAATASSISRLFVLSAVVNFPIMGAGAIASITIAALGVVFGDFCVVSLTGDDPVDSGSHVFSYWAVAFNNQIVIWRKNNFNVALNPSTASVKILVVGV